MTGPPRSAAARGRSSQHSPKERLASAAPSPISWWNGLTPRTKLIAAAVLLAVLTWFFWPSQLSRVTNLDSRGANVIAFGDSLTAGYGAAAGEDYPSKLSALMSEAIINAGVSGDTTEAALARLEPDVLSRDPRIVIVGLGGNDYLRRVDIGSTEAALRAMVRRIHDAGAMVVILGFRFPSFGPSYETMYERVASEEKCLLIPDLLDGVLSDPALRSDAIHPNARGYELMAERVSGPLRKLMAKADAKR
ncbi:MAG TPA: arylesterase [Thermoanaerobaculia bacterium]|nr:arylesterase [Thermoanaerobaculia bacterium]